MISHLILPLLLAATDASAVRPGPFGEASTSPIALDPQSDPPEDEQTKSPWSGSISAGGIIRTGNNKTRTLNITGDSEWRRENNRVSLGVLWSYEDTDRIVTQRKLYGAAKYDRFLSEQTFVYGKTSGDSDKEAGLDLRLTLGAGAGRQFFDDETWKFSAEGGLSGVSEEFETSGENEYLAARLAYNVTYFLNDTWEFTQATEVFPSLEASDDIYARIDTKVQLTLTKSMFAKLQWVLDYDSTPDVGKQRKDNLFSVTLGWSF